MAAPSKRDSGHFSKRGPRSMPFAHSSQNHKIKTSQTCAKFNRPPTASLSNQTQHLHQFYSYRFVSDSSSIVSVKQAAPDNFISDHTIPISPPSPKNRQITASRRKHETIRKRDSKDTMKASNSETVLNLP
jgi:hypothetical protein